MLLTNERTGRRSHDQALTNQRAAIISPRGISWPLLLPAITKELNYIIKLDFNKKSEGVIKTYFHNHFSWWSWALQGMFWSVFWEAQVMNHSSTLPSNDLQSTIQSQQVICNHWQQNISLIMMIGQNRLCWKLFWPGVRRDDSWGGAPWFHKKISNFLQWSMVQIRDGKLWDN